MSVAFTHVEPGGRFSFVAADGSEVTVEHGKPFATDDPGLIAYLDQTPFVKRAGKPSDEADG